MFFAPENMKKLTSKVYLSDATRFKKYKRFKRSENMSEMSRRSERYKGLKVQGHKNS